MQRYRKAYNPPVFHLETASKQQKKIMSVVIDTLDASAIDFFIVDKGKNAHELIITSYGNASYDEKAEIMNEVIDMYIDDKSIEHIQLV